MWECSINLSSDMAKNTKIQEGLNNMKWLNLLFTLFNLSITVFPVKLWTPEKISGMFIVSRPIRNEMKPIEIRFNILSNKKITYIK